MAHKRMEAEHKEQHPVQRCDREGSHSWERTTVETVGRVLAAGMGHWLGARQVRRWAQTRGNAVATRVLSRVTIQRQRDELLAEAGPGTETTPSPAVGDVGPAVSRALELLNAVQRRLRRTSDPAEQRSLLRLEAACSAFPVTHTFPLYNASGLVRQQPLFLARPVVALRRGDAVRVLDTRGSWYRVRARGRAGWLHSRRLFPVLPELRSGGTTGGTTQEDKSVAMTGRG